MKIAFEIGMTNAEFQQATPAEISLRIGIFNERIKQRHDEIVTQSYLTAYYHRVKKMPALKDLLQGKETEQNDNGDSALDEIKRINAALGGNIY